MTEQGQADVEAAAKLAAVRIELEENRAATEAALAELARLRVKEELLRSVEHTLISSLPETVPEIMLEPLPETLPETAATKIVAL